MTTLHSLAENGACRSLRSRRAGGCRLECHRSRRPPLMHHDGHICTQVVKLKAFSKFSNTTEALAAATALVDSKLDKGACTQAAAMGLAARSELPWASSTLQMDGYKYRHLSTPAQTETHRRAAVH